VRHPRRLWARRARVAVQTAAVLLFLGLFRATEYRGSDSLSGWLAGWFRADPLAALGAAVSGRAFSSTLALLWPALVVTVLTVVVGRFVCGWLCPLGALLDGWHRLAVRRRTVESGDHRAWKYRLLVVVLVAAACSCPLAGYLEPFALLFRGLTFAVDPAASTVVRMPFDWAFGGPRWVTAVTEPLYGLCKTYLLPYETMVYGLGLLSAGMLAVPFVLERVGRRFWCRNLCPLGALLAVLGRWGVVRWQGCGGGGEEEEEREEKKEKKKEKAEGRRGGCAASRASRACSRICPMGAIDEDGVRLRRGECILCLDCLAVCPAEEPNVTVGGGLAPPAPVDVGRRQVLAAVGAAMAVPAVLATRASLREPSGFLLRPPGALPEPAFLDRCIRCGECMKVCLGNALQPAWLEAGVEGIFTPRLAPRVGYCEYNCTLCGQVCPTGAIARLTRDQKHRTRMGTAVFDKNRCLPWARGVPCICCEEHCPVPDKAIQLRDHQTFDDDGRPVTVKVPYVVTERCVGCGICENKCPLAGPSAVRVMTRTDETTIERSDGGYGGGYE